MKLVSARRKIGAFVAMSMVFAALVVPATPAAAHGIHFWSLESDPVEITRDGRTFEFSINAYEEQGDSESLGIQFAQTKNPDGPARATQSSQFSFQLNHNQNRFRHPELNLSRASLDTAGELGVYGSIDLRFEEVNDLRSSCNGQIRTRRGTLTGSVDFKSNTALLGTVTARPARATLSFYDSACESAGGEGPANPCPPVGRSLYGNRGEHFYVNAFKYNTADGYRVRLSANQYGWPLRNGEGYLNSELTAVLPGSKMGLGDGLGSGSLTGMAGTFLAGSSDYTATDFDSSLGWNPCYGGRESTMRYSTGRFEGDFRVIWFLHPDTNFAGAGGAHRTIVRDRT